MTSTIERARHRAPVERTTTLSALAGAVSANAGTVGRQAAVIAAASGLVLTTGVAANASGADAMRDVQTSTLNLASVKTVQVPGNVAVSFERDSIAGTTPAPVEEPVAPVAEAPAAVAAPQPAAVAQAPVGTAVKATSLSTTAAVQPAKSVPSGMAATIAAAAYAQLGVGQDCTRLVTNALAAAGINHHGWPASYLSLGRTVSAAEAMPGDLIYYADGGMGMAHIAVYVGGGQAVHGGFNGGSTVVAPAELGSGGVYIRVGG